MVSVSSAVDIRKSVRKFLPDAVDLSTVRRLLERASRAPSGGNTQPWHVYVVTNGRKQRLSELVEKRFEEGQFTEPPEYRIYPKPDESAEYMKRRRKLGYDMYKLMGIERDDQMGRLNALKENFHFFGAPVGIIVTVDRIVDRNGWVRAVLWTWNDTVQGPREDRGITSAGRLLTDDILTFFINIC